MGNTRDLFRAAVRIRKTDILAGAVSGHEKARLERCLAPWSRLLSDANLLARSNAHGAGSLADLANFLADQDASPSSALRSAVMDRAVVLRATTNDGPMAQALRQILLLEKHVALEDGLGWLRFGETWHLCHLQSGREPARTGITVYRPEDALCPLAHLFETAAVDPWPHRS